MFYQINPSINVYYINLDDNGSRRYHIENTLRQYGFTNVVRISAIDTRNTDNINLVKDYIKPEAYNTLVNNITTGKRRSHRELTKGAIGCYLSHLKTYRKIVDENIPYAIIFEDDCSFSDTSHIFWSKMNSIQVPEDTHILLFDAIIHEFNTNNCLSKNICQVYFFFGLHFYLITLIGAHIALQNLLPIECQIDSKLSILSYSNLLRIYGYNGIKFAGQDGKFGTNIQLLNCSGCNVFKEINDIKKFIKNDDYEINKYYLTIIGLSICSLLLTLIIVVIVLTFLLLKCETDK